MRAETVQLSTLESTKTQQNLMIASPPGCRFVTRVLNERREVTRAAELPRAVGWDAQNAYCDGSRHLGCLRRRRTDLWRQSVVGRC